MNKITNPIKPKDFEKRYFMGSKFQNSETERIAGNIVFIQRKMNPEEWTPFTLQDYIENVTHNVGKDEYGVLEAMVNGGKPVPRTTTILSAGYLVKDKTSYCVTDKFLSVIEKFKN